MIEELKEFLSAKKNLIGRDSFEKYSLLVEYDAKRAEEKREENKYLNFFELLSSIADAAKRGEVELLLRRPLLAEEQTELLRRGFSIEYTISAEQTKDSYPKISWFNL